MQSWKQGLGAALALGALAMGAEAAPAPPTVGIGAPRVVKSAKKVEWRWSLSSNRAWGQPQVTMGRIALGRPVALKPGETWSAEVTLAAEPSRTPDVTVATVGYRFRSGASVTSGGTQPNPKKLPPGGFITVVAKTRQVIPARGKVLLARIGAKPLMLEMGR